MKPLRWAEPTTFPSIEAYRLHVVEYWSEVNGEAAFLRPVVQLLKNQTAYGADLIKACEHQVARYFNTLPSVK